MKKENIKTALSAFVEGLRSFVRYPFCFPRAADTRERREPDISRHFGAVGKYISDSCDKFGESVK